MNVVNMEEQYIELIPDGLTRGAPLREAYFLMLCEKGTKKYLPVLLDEEEYVLLLENLQGKTSFSTHLMCRVTRQFGICIENVRLYYTAHGRARCDVLLDDGTQQKRLACNVAEGVAIALECKVPLLISQALLEQLQQRQKGEGQVSMSITAMSDQLLTEALQAAASEDKFELAAILRDELKRRRQREEMYNLAANETISKTSSSEEQS